MTKLKNNIILRCSWGDILRPGCKRFAVGDCRCRAFTLVELLVVISIIAMLLAIMMPSLNKARELAKKVVCFSNMRQMGVALQAYFIDSDNHFPPSSCHIVDGEKYWLNILSKYTGQQLLFRCPADKSKDFVDWSKPLNDQEDKRYSSFATNELLDPECYYYDEEVNKYNNVQFIRNPKYCIWITEMAESEASNPTDHVHPDLWNSIDEAKTFIAYNRHLGKSNYLFADSHVETLEFEDTYSFPKTCYWFPEAAPKLPKMFDEE